MMSAENKQEYPLEIKNVTPQEAAQLALMFPDRTYFRYGPKGYIGNSGIKDAVFSILKMEIRPTDVIVVAHPRSGTTWTQEVIWMLANDLDYEKSNSMKMIERFNFMETSSIVNPAVKNKLLERNRANQRCLEIVEKLSQPAQVRLDQVKSRRFMKTHLPISLLPPNLVDTAKVVYVARDPRDVAVSQYHLYKLFIKNFCDLKTFWNLFMNNMINYTPYFEHLKEAWEQRHHPNMLFLFYEDLTKDISGTVQRVADFLGKRIEGTDLSRLCEHLSFENFKKTDSFIPSQYEEIGLMSESKSFIRRGKAGGWRDYFDSEMTEEAEQWITNNLRDTDLRFPYEENN